MKLILTGDVNLMNVTDPAVPFARVADELRDALVFSNFECCLFDPGGHSFHNEGFYAHPGPGGEALELAGIDAVGIANNVNYGEAAILGSIARLDALAIPPTGAGRNVAAARAAAIVKRDGLTCGFLQRSSVYWPTNHEAGTESAGIAVLRGHTAYHVPLHKTRPEIPPPNRPGVPPEIVTWADKAYLRAFTDDIAALKARAEIVVASCHWGLGQEVLDYMTEIAHAAIDAGAHMVMGHGPHYSLPVEVYKGRPIFYGLGSFSFHTGHGGRMHGDWLGMMVRASWEGGRPACAAFQFVPHDRGNRSVLCALANEGAALDEIVQHSGGLGARLTARGDEVEVDLRT